MEDGVVESESAVGGGGDEGLKRDLAAERLGEVKVMEGSL